MCNNLLIFHYLPVFVFKIQYKILANPYTWRLWVSVQAGLTNDGLGEGLSDKEPLFLPYALVLCVHWDQFKWHVQ